MNNSPRKLSMFTAQLSFVIFQEAIDFGFRTYYYSAHSFEAARGAWPMRLGNQSTENC